MTDYATLAPIGYMIHDIARLMKRRFEEQAKAHDMTLPQWRVLSQLSRNDTLSQVALAGLIESDPMTVSGILDRLETKGLVERSADPNDSRAKLAKVTDKARVLVGETWSLALEVYEQAIEGLTAEDKDALTAGLTVMRDNLVAHADDKPRKKS